MRRGKDMRVTRGRGVGRERRIVEVGEGKRHEEKKRKDNEEKDGAGGRWW